MPLLDPFHPPLSNHRPWESIHSELTSSIARQLNGKVLPPHFVALPRVHFGGRMEVDVATVDEGGGLSASAAGGTATAVWAPPRATLEAAVDFTDPDVLEVQVFDEGTGYRLVAAVELV